MEDDNRSTLAAPSGRDHRPAARKKPWKLRSGPPALLPSAHRVRSRYSLAAKHDPGRAGSRVVTCRICLAGEEPARACGTELQIATLSRRLPVVLNGKHRPRSKSHPALRGLFSSRREPAGALATAEAREGSPTGLSAAGTGGRRRRKGTRLPVQRAQCPLHRRPKNARTARITTTKPTR